MTLPAVIEQPSIEPEALTLADYNAIKRALIQNKITDARNVLIVQMLFGTGLRIAELLRITPECVESNGPETTILVRRGKKRKDQYRYDKVALKAELGVSLRSYISGNNIPTGKPVFGITARQVERIVKEAALRGIGRPAHPHQFRGLMITTLIDAGIALPVVAKYVGHSDIQTTLNWYYQQTRDRKLEIANMVPV